MRLMVVRYKKLPAYIDCDSDEHHVLTLMQD